VKSPFGYLYKSNYPYPKQWQVDQDYADKLSPEEKEWLNQFNMEYYAGRIPPGKKLHKKKHIKDLYNKNNANYRDLMSRGSRANTPPPDRPVYGPFGPDEPTLPVPQPPKKK
jgi:hypothetical protein